MLKQQWHSGVALMTALSLGTGTLISLAGAEFPANARTVSQQNNGSSRTIVAQSNSGLFTRGTVIDVAEPNGRRIVLAPNDSANVTLVTTRTIQANSGYGAIPRGTKIEGEFRPVGDGTQFVAKRIIFRNSNSRNIDARSNIVSYRTTVKKGSTDPIWQGALAGGGASVIISSVVSKPGIAKTLAGAGAGALAGYLIGGGGSKSKEVIVVRPNQSLALTLDSDLVLSPY